MKQSNLIFHSLADFTASDVIKSRPFQITLLMMLAIWLVDPAIHAFLLHHNTYWQQLLEPEPMEVYTRTVAIVLTALIGIVSSLALIRIRKQQESLAYDRERLQQIFDSGPECLKTMAKDGSLLEMNPAGLKLIEADSIDQVRGQSVYDLIAPEHRQLFIDFNQRIFAGHSEQINYDIVGLNGTRKSMESHAVPLHNMVGEITAHLAITRDITQSKKMTEKLNYQASHDMLTGLLNRHELERRIDNSLILAVADRSIHAVFIIDVDQFKLINDTCGHSAGDQLLQQIGNILRNHVRKKDSVARFGGDEFAVLLEYCSPHTALNIAEKIRIAIDETKFPWEGRQFHITVSMGVVTIDQTSSNVSDILRDADTACYHAKDLGRNRVELFQIDNETSIGHRQEMRWVAKIHEGIEEDRFTLFAQVIENLNVESQEKHVELLLRYRNDKQGLTPPGAFLPAAERYGISPKLDRHVIEMALTVLGNNPALLAEFDCFCINLSGLSLSDGDFLQFVVEQFERRPVLARSICFEITETAAISNLQNARRFISTLKSNGCRFALDDFGSGLSSFGYLKELSVDYVKIDGGFVKDIIDDPIDLAMVRSINDIAHLMDNQTIAEYVENDLIKQQLRRLGVDYAQGYGIAKPIPLQELVDSEAMNSTFIAI